MVCGVRPIRKLAMSHQRNFRALTLCDKRLGLRKHGLSITTGLMKRAWPAKAFAPKEPIKLPRDCRSCCKVVVIAQRTPCDKRSLSAFAISKLAKYSLA